MSHSPLDTSDDALKKMYQIQRELSCAERLEKVLSLISGLSQLAIHSIRAEVPNISDKELYVRYAQKLHGREIAEKVFRKIAHERFAEDDS